MRWIRGLALFVAGTLLGTFVTQPSAAPQEKLTGLRLNHFGIYTKDLDESMNFYTKTMGFREAFLELAPATADRPVGFSHVGLWVDDLKTTVAAIRQQGVKVEDIRTGSTKAPLTNVVDPNGVRLELLEYPPESLQRKAIEGWK